MIRAHSIRLLAALALFASPVSFAGNQFEQEIQSIKEAAQFYGSLMKLRKDAVDRFNQGWERIGVRGQSIRKKLDELREAPKADVKVPEFLADNEANRVLVRLTRTRALADSLLVDLATAEAENDEEFRAIDAAFSAGGFTEDTPLAKAEAGYRDSVVSSVRTIEKQVTDFRARVTERLDQWAALRRKALRGQQLAQEKKIASDIQFRADLQSLLSRGRRIRIAILERLQRNELKEASRLVQAYRAIQDTLPLYVLPMASDESRMESYRFLREDLEKGFDRILPLLRKKQLTFALLQIKPSAVLARAEIRGVSDAVWDVSGGGRDTKGDVVTQLPNGPTISPNTSPVVMPPAFSKPDCRQIADSTRYFVTDPGVGVTFFPLISASVHNDFCDSAHLLGKGPQGSPNTNALYNRTEAYRKIIEQLQGDEDYKELRSDLGPLRDELADFSSVQKSYAESLGSALPAGIKAGSSTQTDWANIADGFRGAFDQVVETAHTIAENPSIVASVGSRIVHEMSEPPEFFQGLLAPVVDFARVMDSGTWQEREVAFGKFIGNLVLGVATDGVVGLPVVPTEAVTERELGLATREAIQLTGNFAEGAEAHILAGDFNEKNELAGGLHTVEALNKFKETLAPETWPKTEKLQNGVVRATFPPNAMAPKAFKATKSAADYGRCAPGGKALFPESWSGAKILDAIKSVARDGKIDLFGRSGGVTKVGVYDGVKIEVKIDHSGNIRSGFPSWNQ